MAVKKFQIFVSSTYSDLQSERSDAIKSILDMKHLPSGMESFPAADVQQLTYIKKLIDECDYYLLIIKNRYGSIENESGLSFTELEYDYAIETKKTVLAFIKNTSEDDGESDNQDSLDRFKLKVSKRRLVKIWDTPKDLQASIIISLNETISNFPAVGWIRGDTAASEELLAKNNALLQENAELNAKVANFSNIQNPKYENIAGLDEFFAVRCHLRSHYSDSFFEPVNFSWLQIFLSLAAELEKPKTIYAITSAIKLAAKEYLGKTDVVKIDSADATRIKVQLVAHGLIEARLMSLTTGGQEEFIYLTQKGKNTFADKFVVRRANV